MKATLKNGIVVEGTSTEMVIFLASQQNKEKVTTQQVTVPKVTRTRKKKDMSLIFEERAFKIKKYIKKSNRPVSLTEACHGVGICPGGTTHTIVKKILDSNLYGIRKIGNKYIPTSLVEKKVVKKNDKRSARMKAIHILRKKYTEQGYEYIEAFKLATDDYEKGKGKASGNILWMSSRFGRTGAETR